MLQTSSKIACPNWQCNLGMRIGCGHVCGSSGTYLTHYLHLAKNTNECVCESERACVRVRSSKKMMNTCPDSFSSLSMVPCNGDKQNDETV